MLVAALVAAVAVAAGAGGGLPAVATTVGAVWPLPQLQVPQDTYLTVQPGDFRFVVVEKGCQVLNKVLERYTTLIKETQLIVPPEAPAPDSSLLRGQLQRVAVWVLHECSDVPYLHMDEHYQIKIDSPDRPGEGAIIATSVWGAIRAVETFAQLLVPLDDTTLRINSTQIMDFPRFPYRGFMIDTSRHYLPVATIEEMLELMAMNKLNTLHWHIVDDQSFPYESSAFPELSGAGAYTEHHVYSQEDVSRVVEFAAERGVRVVPEFDTPGHVASWGLSQKGLLTECYDTNSSKPNGKYGPIDPSREENYSFLSELFKEVSLRFPDQYLHLGGDEVPYDCWKSNPGITKFMKEQGMAGNYSALEQYYISRVLNIVHNFTHKTSSMVWQDVFDNGVALAEDTVVHVWKDMYAPAHMKSELANVTKAGYQVVLSSCWYLNYISYGEDWVKYYACDPQHFNGTVAQKQLVQGGEACMWGEWVDDTNIVARSWPRGSVVAERLWSDPEMTRHPTEAKPRLQEHRCRMVARGHQAEPLGTSSYCPL